MHLKPGELDTYYGLWSGGHTGDMRVLGLPLPAGWFDGVHCREYEHDGRYVFQVEAALPLAGMLIRYEGWLEPA